MEQECPDCKVPMRDEPTDERLVCDGCGKIEPYSGLPPLESGRRYMRVPLSMQMCEQILFGFDFTDDVFLKLPVVTNFPRSAKFIGSFTDPRTIDASFVFQDDSFELVGECCEIPNLDLEFHTRHIFTIPEEPLERLCTELERTSEFIKGFPKQTALNILLNKLKKAVGRSPDLFEEVSWKSLKDKEE